MAMAQFVRFGLPESDQASFQSRIEAINELSSAERRAFTLSKELVQAEHGYAFPDGAALRIEKCGVVTAWRRIDYDAAPYLGDDWRNEVDHA